MLTVRDLRVRYGGIHALHGLSVDVAEGETVLLVGANGAGKSSLINAVCGLAPVHGGRIHFAGEDVTGVPCAQRARRGIGYSPEGRRVFASMSVADNVLVGAFARTARQRDEAFEWVRSTFPLIAKRATQPAGLLSGGEQQIVALARAAAAFPKLLLLDEPFLGLAPVWIAQISEAIRSLQQRGTSILMTEQMARPALKLADRVYVLRSGEVSRSGTVETMREFALADEYL